MPTRLKNLRIKRVALVDEGANPDAYIRFAKRRDENDSDTEMTADEAQGIVGRFFSAISKLWNNGNPIAKKDGKTFAEIASKQDYSTIMEKEVWPMIYAMSDSARSILMDDDRDEGAKEALLVQSAKEFADTFAASAASWAKGLETGNVAKSTADLIQLRDQLNSCIAKSVADMQPPPAIDDSDSGAESTQPPEPEPASPEPAPTEPEDETPVQTDNTPEGEMDMTFDTDRMSPEEKSQFDDLAKRYGHTEPASPEQVATATEVPADSTQEDDVYKGLNPAVRQELETLRKFREETEQKQYMDIAKGYAILGKQPEQLANLLKSLKSMGGTAYDDMISTLDAAKAQLENSGLFSEIGKRGASDSAGDSWAKIETIAQDIAKARPELTRAQAIDEACMQHPELVDAYEKSRR